MRKMASNLNDITPLSPSFMTQANGSSLLTQKSNKMMSYQQNSQLYKEKERPVNAVSSSFSPEMNQTGFTLQHKSLESSEVSSVNLRKQLLNTPKVSNYSEDLNSMMESYFSKKLKQIRTNIAELHKNQIAKKMNSKKNFNLALNKKANSKNPINTVEKNLQTESLVNNNSVALRKELNDNKLEGETKFKKSKGFTQRNSYTNVQSKTSQINNDKEKYEKQKDLLSMAKEKQKQEAAKERREKTSKVNRNDKVNGLKCEYYAENNCVHRIFLSNTDLKNVKKINQSLKELFSAVFKKDIDITICLNNTYQKSTSKNIIYENTPRKEGEEATKSDRKLMNKESKEFRNLIKGKDPKDNHHTGNSSKANKNNRNAVKVDKEGKGKCKGKPIVITDSNIITNEYYDTIKSDYDILNENESKNELNACNNNNNTFNSNSNKEDAYVKEEEENHLLQKEEIEQK